MLTAFLLLALAQRQRPSMPAPAATDWKIEITTDGGFTGIGSGGLTVTANGKLVMAQLSGKQCTFQLSASDLVSLNDAIANARPATWLGCYSLADVRSQCCDLIRTTLNLSLHSGRDVYVTSWLTGSPPFPPDLQSLVDVLRGAAGIDARYRPLCTP